MAIPANPTGLKATYNPVAQAVTVTWNAVANATEIRLQRWTNQTNYYTDLTTVPGNVNYHLDDSGLADGAQYAYRALSVNAEGNPTYYSSPSNIVTIIDPSEPVTDLTAERDFLDENVDLAWTNNPTTRAPYDFHYIHRWNNVDNAWPQINRIVGALTSYEDYATIPDRAHKYKVMTTNSSVGPFVFSMESGIIYTKPAEPTGITARWVGNDIVVSWTNPSTIAVNFEIDHTVDNIEWDPVASLGKVTAWTMSAPERGVDHRFRIRAASPVPTVGSRVLSEWSQSLWVPAQSSPNPPTVYGPAFAPTGEAFTVEYIHNPTSPDSPEGGVQLRYRDQGETTWSATVSGATVPPQAGTGVVEVSLATRTDTSGWSDWSTPLSVQLRARPAVTLTSPSNGATITGPVVPVAWTTAVQTSWQAELVEGGSTVGQKSGATGASTTFAVEDASSYTTRVRVSDGYLWSNWASANTTTAFSAAGNITLTLTPNEEDATIAVVVALTSAPYPSRVEIFRRRVDSGEWVSLGDTVNGSLLDRLAPLRTDLEYVAIGWTSTGSSTSSTLGTARLEKVAAVINYGPTYGESVEVSCGFDTVSMSYERDATLRQFAKRTYPVEVLGTAYRRAVSVSGSLFDREGDLVDANERWETAVRSDVKWYRDFTGLSFRCSLTSIDGDRGYYTSEISFKAEEISG